MFLQAPAPAAPTASLLFPMLIFFVFMIFFVFIPQYRQRKAQQKLTESLKEGMEVYTNAGIVGRITKVEANTVRLMVDEKSFVKVLKSSIAGEYKG